MTVPASTSDEGWFDLGATWHWSDQPSIGAMATRLGLVAFPEPEGGDALHERAAGRLVECLLPESVSLGMKVAAVGEDGQGARVTTVASDGTNTCETEHRHPVPIAYGHPLFRQPGRAGKIYWAGTEIASWGDGHMEGAVQSGHAAARLVLHAHRSGGA